jgi:cytosine/adenosine deaminase-related metal-dependent hydrolase
MSYRKISADKIYTVTGETLRNHVVLVNTLGEITDIVEKHQIAHSDIEHYRGALIPGFINAHCHLELSHMRDKVATGTGLIPFIRSVIKFRDIPDEEIQDAILQADKDMFDAGIMAVGDISNKTDTIAVKTSSKLRYFTFVEFFDLMQTQLTQSTFDQYLKVYNAFPENDRLRKSASPHAPYSVTPALFNKLRELQRNTDTISIHNQETPGENELFLNGTGDFYAFYTSLGLSLDHFSPSGTKSIQYAINHGNPNCKNLFVHNTLSEADDIEAAIAWNPQCYWATCPNANLYIENRLPDYKLFLEKGATVCIGTDSLTSNWQLSIWEEMRSIMKYQSYVSFDTLLEWATINGAKALGFDKDLGSIEVGKSPGLLLLSLNAMGEVDRNSEVKRLL